MSFRASRIVLAVLLAAVAALAAGCGRDEDPADLRRITFMAGFRAQANLPFVAVYVADAEGFFEAEGLAVEIQHSSGQDEHLKLLLDGAIQFTTGTAAQVLRRNEDDLPVVAVALFGQRGDQGYVARADSGIRGPADFRGKSVGFKAGVVPAELLAMLRGAGLSASDVSLVSVGFDPRTFIEGQVDVYPVFLNNEPDTIRRAGVDITVIDPHDHGVPTLGLTFLAHRETLEGDRDLVERFLRATLRAIRWIEEHPEDAIGIVLRHAPGADAEHQRFLLDTDLEAARRADGIGRASREQWEALAGLLLEHDVLSKPVDVGRAYDGSVVDGLYESGAIR
jgi:ABC-type nitrate/sulfonate/bicarbonate transport system substrate-binding protein